MRPLQLKEIEDECKAHVGKALSVFSKEVPLEQARPIRGLRAVFGEVQPATQQEHLLQHSLIELPTMSGAQLSLSAESSVCPVMRESYFCCCTCVRW